jgi:carbamoyltransferase
MNPHAGSKPTFVLGIGLSHNGAACLLKDGRIEVAIEKERLTRVKNDGGNDRAAIDYCLSAAGIKQSDLAVIVQNANFGSFAYGNQWYRGFRALSKMIPVVTISHHLAHACSAFFLSPFEEAAVLTVDGCGNAFEDCMDLDGAILAERPAGDLASLWFEKDSYYAASGTGLQPLYKDFSPFGRLGCDYPMHPTTTRHSIGGLYAGASTYVFGNHGDLGKLMGLAPYGRPGTLKAEIFDVRDGRVFMNYDWIDAFTDRVRSEPDFKARFQYFADVALMVQKEIERALLAVVRHRHRLHPVDNLCFAGGVALNAVANQRILRETPFKRVFVPPAADDSGLAVGCAYYGWHHVLQQRRILHDGTPFFGRRYGTADFDRVAEAAATELVVERPADMIAAAADLLAAGRTLAWFDGGSEFGPRALGHRSILADARRPELRDYINANVKFREDFRPFAPSVLAEDAADYFELSGDSPYMLFVVSVREAWRDKIGAVVHVDGTARVQTVRREGDPRFHALLSAFKERTSVGMLLNTSLNRRGEPLVETPAEALTLVRETGLHGLAIGPYLITKPGESVAG